MASYRTHQLKNLIFKATWNKMAYYTLFDDKNRNTVLLFFWPLLSLQMCQIILPHPVGLFYLWMYALQGSLVSSLNCKCTEQPITSEFIWKLSYSDSPVSLNISNVSLSSKARANDSNLHFQWTPKCLKMKLVSFMPNMCHQHIHSNARMCVSCIWQIGRSSWE